VKSQIYLCFSEREYVLSPLCYESASDDDERQRYNLVSEKLKAKQHLAQIDEKTSFFSAKVCSAQK